MIVAEEVSFFEKVYEVVQLIPRGKVTSYGVIAGFLGSKGAARMVGWAMNKSHTYKTYVPAHRVINQKGLLTGKHHFNGVNKMQILLEAEGIEVEDNQIQNLEKVLWNPEVLLK